MKVLLVMPPIVINQGYYSTGGDFEFPVSICYLAALIEKIGKQVEIFDGRLSQNLIEDFSDLFDKGNFDVVGFSTVTASTTNTMKLAAVVKQKKPSTVTIIGGVHPTIIGPKILDQMRDIDIAVFGEGEQTIAELLRNLETNQPLSNVCGLAFREGSNIVQTGRRELIKDLDSLPFPAYHLVDIPKYGTNPGLFIEKPIIAIITSRGCPYNCNFCADSAIWQHKCRLRSAQKVVDEMELLVKEYRVKEIKFFDDTFTFDRKRVIEICNEILKINLKVIWRCASRVDQVDLELLRLMKKAGCCSISFGLESGSDEMLKKMNKGTTTQQGRVAVKLAKQAGLYVNGFFMLNYPGDTIETTEQTIRFSRELGLDYAGFNLVIPHFGTQMYEEIKKNYKVDPKVWDNPDAPLGNQVYFYQDSLPPDYLIKAYRRAGLWFYMRPRIIFGSLLRIRNFAMLKSYTIAMLQILKLRAKKSN
jgi:anaerobic magnesium-protoporphyrin IX monomethyl ester cyclase